jgi:hypothetical protein
MAKLYLTVYERDQGCDWFHHTSDEFPTALEIETLIKDHYDLSDDEDIDDFVDDHWTNEVSEQDGYTIKLEEKE